MIKKALLLLAVAMAATVAAPVVLMAAAVPASGPSPSSRVREEIPPAYLALYRQAALERCPTLPWAVLAGVGKVESNHGRLGGARLQPDGTVAPPIVGPRLDGTAGTARITDTDTGRYDSDATFDRAVGPMQFIPATWSAYGVDATGDGVADPHNAADAVHAAAEYLCANGANDPTRLTDAIWAYNHSRDYVQAVRRWTDRYTAPDSH